MNTDLASKKCLQAQNLIERIETLDEFLKDFTKTAVCEVKFVFPKGDVIYFRDDTEDSDIFNYPTAAAGPLIELFKLEKKKRYTELEKVLEELKKATLAEVAW